MTFLASLELSRLRKLKIFQESTYTTIYLELLEQIKGMQLGLATEFDKTLMEQTDLTAPSTEARLEEHSAPIELAIEVTEAI